MDVDKDSGLMFRALAPPDRSVWAINGGFVHMEEVQKYHTGPYELLIFSHYFMLFHYQYGFNVCG